MNAQPPPPPLWKVNRYLRRGLEQQLWLWGQDVRHGGNLLVRHGFHRFRTGSKTKSSHYRLTLADGATIELHAFVIGIYGADAAGFCFIRGRDAAYLYEGPEPPDPKCFCDTPLVWPETESQRAAFHAAAARFLTWAEEYERWIEALVGPAYRAGLFRHVTLPWLEPASARAWFAAYARDPLSASVPRRRTGRTQALASGRTAWSAASRRDPTAARLSPRRLAVGF
jgi:hypothetical protein